MEVSVIKDVFDKLEKKFIENENDIKKLMKDQEFLLYLRSISINLNNKADNSFQWDLLEQYNIFKILTKLLEYYFNTLNVNDDDDKIFRPLRYLIEVIYKISHRSLKFVEKFTHYNMFQMYIDLFKKLDLIQFLFEAFLIVLSKLINIFHYICKKELHILNQNIHLTVEDFTILRKAKDRIEKLSVNDEKIDLQKKPIFRLFLTCLSYLQVRFHTNEPLVSLNDFSDAFENGYIHTNFRETSNAFLVNSELVEYEFYNEKHELEIQKVHKLNISGYRNDRAADYGYYGYFLTFEQIIDNISVLCFDYEKKHVGYDYFKYFIKSLLMYGLDIEKLLGLKCLNDFLAVSKVKKDLVEDKRFMEFLKNMETNSMESNHETQQRLNVMIQKTLALIFN